MRWIDIQIFFSANISKPYNNKIMSSKVTADEGEARVN